MSNNKDTTKNNMCKAKYGRLIGNIILFVIYVDFSNTEMGFYKFLIGDFPIIYSIILTIIYLLFLIKSIFSIISIVYIAKANKRYNCDNKIEADIIYKKAQLFGNIGWVIFGISILLTILLSIMTFMKTVGNI